MSQTPTPLPRTGSTGHIATITYNRPEAMNAINGDMRQCLNAAWMEFYNDPDAWVAIMTGSGRAYCAGADLRDPTRGSAGDLVGFVLRDPDHQQSRERS